MHRERLRRRQRGGMEGFGRSEGGWNGGEGMGGAGGEGRGKDDIDSGRELEG